MNRADVAHDGSRLLAAALVALASLAWLLCHPYLGLFHDANLYALQALTRLDTDALRQTSS